MNRRIFMLTIPQVCTATYWSYVSNGASPLKRDRSTRILVTLHAASPCQRLLVMKRRDVLAVPADGVHRDNPSRAVINVGQLLSLSVSRSLFPKSGHQTAILPPSSRILIDDVQALVSHLPVGLNSLSFVYKGTVLGFPPSPRQSLILIKVCPL